MAIENFKPTLWEKSIIENFYDNCFIEQITTPPTETKGGNKVIFNRINKALWKQYTSGQKIDWDTVSSTKVELDFDKSLYMAFMVDDIDKVQSNQDVLKAVTKEQSGILGEQICKEVITYISTNLQNVINTKDKPLQVNKDNAYDLLVDLNVKLSQKAVPMDNRFIIISPKFLGLLEKDNRFTKEYTILTNGIIDGAKVNGSSLIVTNCIPDDAVLLVHKSSIGFAFQLGGTPEVCRLESYIADGVRAVTNYGYTTLRDESSVLSYITY